MSIESKLCFPEKILEQHLVVLGKTGAGKSSALRHCVEHLLIKNKRVCVIDPKGDWWGLKLGADGKSPGLPVIMFGDFKQADAQDVPINDRSGKHIAELVSTGNRPCVIGMRGWSQGAMIRFWIDFASTLFAKNAGELYLVGDEYHNFAPKQWKGMSTSESPAGVGLHWSNRLLSEGRGLGIVCLIASQRPQKVHNDTLTSCETLVAMRVVHAADRAAVKAWIDGNGDPEVGIKVLGSLASMPRGDGWVWSPEVQFGPKQISFPLFKTFDSFAPPQLQKKISQKGWAGVDLVAVKEKLAAVIQEEQAKDPAKLRARIQELEREARARDAAAAAVKPVEKTKRVEVKILTDKQIARLERVAKAMETATRSHDAATIKLTEARNACLTEAGRIVQAIGAARTAVPAPSPMPAAAVVPRPAPKLVMKVETTHGSSRPLRDGEFSPNGPQTRILNALAWLESIGMSTPAKSAVGFVAKLKPSGGHFDNTIGPLSKNGLIEYPLPGQVQLTDAGRAFTTPPQEAPTLKEYHTRIKTVLAAGPTIKLFETMVAAGGADLTSEQLGERAGLKPGSGHFDNSIGPLSTLGLVVRKAGLVKPTDLMFPPSLIQ